MSMNLLKFRCSETALINWLIVLITFVVVLCLFVCSIARTGYQTGPNGPNATVLEY